MVLRHHPCVQPTAAEQHWNPVAGWNSGTHYVMHYSVKILCKFMRQSWFMCLWIFRFANYQYLSSSYVLLPLITAVCKNHKFISCLQPICLFSETFQCQHTVFLCQPIELELFLQTLSLKLWVPTCNVHLSSLFVSWDNTTTHRQHSQTESESESPRSTCVNVFQSGFTCVCRDH